MPPRLRVIVAFSVLGCGARTELDVPGASDAALAEAQTPRDAGQDVALDSPAACDFGNVTSDPFGATVSWNGGAPLPAGHYRVTYVDGCMKYSTAQGWTVNAYANGPDTLWVVGSGARLAPAPGTVGFLVGQGGFSTFDACVSANESEDAPLELDFAGGTLGLELADSPYADNVAGESGRNPTYRLSSCA